MRTAVDVPVMAHDVPVAVHNKLAADARLPLAADGVIAAARSVALSIGEIAG